jgi:hypothetical protein
VAETFPLEALPVAQLSSEDWWRRRECDEGLIEAASTATEDAEAEADVVVGMEGWRRGEGGGGTCSKMLMLVSSSVVVR